VTGNGLDRGSAGELRRLVREVLADVLVARTHEVRGHPAAGKVPTGIPAGQPVRPDSMIVQDPPPDRRKVLHDHDGGPSDARAGDRAWEVRIGSDDDLRDFALRVLALADNPKQRRDLITGRIRFRLAGPREAAARQAVHRVDKGAVTERAVAAAAAAGARLLLGPRAVLTPLGKDKARALGVPVEKER
jgi:hypothetical protein